MPDALSVEFKLLGIAQAGRDLTQFAQEMRRFNDGSSGGTGSGGALSQERQLAQMAKIRQDAQLRNENTLAQARKDRLKQEANEEKQRKAGQAKVEKMAGWDRPNASDRISRLVHSSRIGMDESGQLNLMPLVGSLSSAFGPLAPMVLAATAAMEKLDAASQQAAAAMRAFRSAQFTGGGTAYETAYGETIGRSLGFNPESAGKDVAQQARAFADRITSDPVAMGAANRYGISDTPTVNGKLDKMEGLMQWLDKLRQMAPDEAVRNARATGTEDFLGVRDLSDTTFQQIRESAARRAGLNSPSRLSRDADRQARDAMDGMESPFNPENIGRGMREWTGGAGMRGPEQNDPGRDFREGQQRQQQAQEGHTSALNQNTQALQGLNQLIRGGIYGGGERTQGAVPSAFIGAGWQNKQLRATAHALGAFGV